MKIRPPAVTIGPPMLGMPQLSASGILPRVVPSGTCQRIVPFAMSTALSVPQGGAVHGRPSGESSGSRRMP